MAAILPLVLQLINLAITYAPELEGEANLVMSLLQSGADPTPEQQAQIDAGLDRANSALAAAVAAKTGAA